MKKLLSLAIAVLLTVGLASAQSSSGSIVLKSTPTHVPTDTVANTATKSQFAKISVINSKVGIQVDLTTISGTPAGVVRLFGSINDGSTTKKFVRILKTDSLLVGVNSLSKQFVVVDPVYTDYKVEYVGSGTHSTKMNSLAVFRKE